MKMILHFVLAVVAVMIVAMYVPGIDVTSWQAAVVAVIALFIARLTISPILHIVALPINLITLGLFGFVINGLVFFLVARFVDGFDVATVVAGIIGAFVVAVIKTIGGKIIDIVV